MDGKKIKKEQVPVFVEIQEAKGDSFCLPNTHLRINHNQNLDNLPFQCDICWKKFNFFASFALHAQMAHKEGCRIFQPLNFIKHELFKAKFSFETNYLLKMNFLQGKSAFPEFQLTCSRGPCQVHDVNWT